MKQWFSEWFDSEYYHILYQNRDFEEAALFIENLLSYLSPSVSANFLDLACGKGRHAIQVNKHGFETHGCDFSEESILQASQFESPTLQFYVQDMRVPLPYKYNYILNLFTSFGYFDTNEEHLNTLKNIYNALKADGLFVFDFLNKNHVEKNLVSEEVVVNQQTAFEIKRCIAEGHILKNIQFKDEDGAIQKHIEKVRAFSPSELYQLFKQVGFEIQDTFGNYALTPFDSEKSERFIAILKKC